MDNLDQNIFGNSENQLNEIEHGGYDSFKSLELEELEREFDRLFGTFTENEPEVVEKVFPNTESSVDLSNTDTVPNHKINVFGNYKTGIDLGENSTKGFGIYGINKINNNHTDVGFDFEATNVPETANGLYKVYGLEDAYINNTGFDFEATNIPETANSVFGNFDLDSYQKNNSNGNQQSQKSQQQQAITIIKKTGLWAKIKAFIAGSNNLNKSQMDSASMSYNQNLNVSDFNRQQKNISTDSTSKGFWNFLKGNK